MVEEKNIKPSPCMNIYIENGGSFGSGFFQLRNNDMENKNIVIFGSGMICAEDEIVEGKMTWKKHSTKRLPFFANS